MEEMAEVGARRFGDEQSILLDRFERMSLEAHLKRAMLSRSLSESEPRLAIRSRSRVGLVGDAGAIPMATQGKQRRRRGPGFLDVLRKLVRPILGMKNTASIEHVPDHEHLLSWKAFRRSLRF